MKKLLSLLILPVMGLTLGLVASSFNSGLNDNYVSVSATSIEGEAFLNKYQEIRTIQHDEDRSICDTTKDEYNQLIALYRPLSQSERDEINALKDPYDTKSTIGEVMKEIIRLFYSPKNTNDAPKQRLNQSTTIIIAVVVSIFGMSAISVLFILKNNKYIE